MRVPGRVAELMSVAGFVALATSVGVSSVLSSPRAAMHSVAARTLMGSAASGSQQPQGTWNAPCPPGPPPPGSGIPPCVPGHNADNSAEAQAKAAKTWPVSGSYISEGAAIHAAKFSHPVTGAAHALRTTYANAAQLMDESPTPELNPRTEVWIVTLTSEPGQKFQAESVAPGGNALTSSYFSIILDAVNGGGIDDCTGCNSVTTG